MSKLFIVKNPSQDNEYSMLGCFAWSNSIEIAPEELELLKCKLEGKATRFSDEIIRSENLLKKLEEIL